MSNWDKKLGISKKAWDNLTPATQELLLNRFKKEEARNKARTRRIGSRKGGRSQKEGQEVAKRIAQGKGKTPYRTSTYKGNEPTKKFLKEVINRAGSLWIRSVDNLKIKPIKKN